MSYQQEYAQIQWISFGEHVVSKERCKRCDGAKEVMGLGAMKVKCDVCSGTGFIDVIVKRRRAKATEE